MANYRPKSNTITAASNDSGTIVVKNLSTTTWGLALLKGTARGAGGTALGSATVLVWESGTATTATAIRWRHPANPTTAPESVHRCGPAGQGWRPRRSGLRLRYRPAHRARPARARQAR